MQELLAKQNRGKFSQNRPTLAASAPVMALLNLMGNPIVVFNTSMGNPMNHGTQKPNLENIQIYVNSITFVIRKLILVAAAFQSLHSIAPTW